MKKALSLITLSLFLLITSCNNSANSNSQDSTTDSTSTADTLKLTKPVVKTDTVKPQAPQKVYYVVVRAFTNREDAEYLNNNAPGDTEYGGVRKVKAGGRTYYLVIDNSGVFTDKSKAEKSVEEFNNITIGDDRAWIWESTEKSGTDTVNDDICSCEECGSMENFHKCHNKGKWAIVEGRLCCRCSNCSEWAEGCDLGCQCH